ncbi:hypothetical protein HY024_03290 [Candidatus Curtissbacteria bacterium]|nr:hypothetical protein [Candidatus Curtissbacteria bacterium]
MDESREGNTAVLERPSGQPGEPADHPDDSHNGRMSHFRDLISMLPGQHREEAEARLQELARGATAGSVEAATTEKPAGPVTSEELKMPEGLQAPKDIGKLITDPQAVAELQGQRNAFNQEYIKNHSPENTRVKMSTRFMSAMKNVLIKAVSIAGMLGGH